MAEVPLSNFVPKSNLLTQNLEEKSLLLYCCAKALHQVGSKCYIQKSGVRYEVQIAVKFWKQKRDFPAEPEEMFCSSIVEQGLWQKGGSGT